MLKADTERWIKDNEAVEKHLLSPTQAALARLVLEGDRNQMGQDARILDAEIMQMKTVAFNSHHPEHQYADMTDTIALLVKIHNDLQAPMNELRVKVNWPVT